MTDRRSPDAATEATTEKKEHPPAAAGDPQQSSALELMIECCSRYTTIATVT